MSVDSRPGKRAPVADRKARDFLRKADPATPARRRRHRDERHRRDRRPAALLLPRPVREPCRADRVAGRLARRGGRRACRAAAAVSVDHAHGLRWG